MENMFGAGITEGLSAMGYGLTMRAEQVDGFDATKWTFSGKANTTKLFRMRKYPDSTTAPPVAASAMNAVLGQRVIMAAPGTPPSYGTITTNFTDWVSSATIHHLQV